MLIVFENASKQRSGLREELRHLARRLVKATDKIVGLPRSQDACERMRRSIDSPRIPSLHSQRIGMVEPVYGKLRHNKRLMRLNLRGPEKVKTVWHLDRMVHNNE